jgi:hypothetical protein
VLTVNKGRHDYAVTGPWYQIQYSHVSSIRLSNYQMHAFYGTGKERHADSRLQDSSPRSVSNLFQKVAIQHLDLSINLCNRNVENTLGFMLTIIG